jgi:hypothetical protein
MLLKGTIGSTQRSSKPAIAEMCRQQFKREIKTNQAYSTMIHTKDHLIVKLSQRSCL